MAARAAERAATLLVATLIALLISEGVVRLLSETDDDGQAYLFGERLRPYQLPVARSTKLLEEYASAPSSYYVYDPQLGWSIRPDSLSTNGLYRSNAAGLRADRDYDLQPKPGTVRIAIFGDSFTHGDDVPFEDAWGHRLEQALARRGIEAEVLNFGAGGYGMDQAYLRWQRDGRRYSPDIVVFGFQPENVLRNVNLFRTMYDWRYRTPFSKPRFVWENERLGLVNSPTVPPGQIPSVLARFADSPLSEYELFFDDAYTKHGWLHSRLLAAFAGVFAGDSGDGGWGSRRAPLFEQARFYDPGSESGSLALHIARAFRDDVERHGADFVVVHLPSGPFLARIRDARPLPYAELLTLLDERYAVVHVEDGMKELPLESYVRAHYTPLGNAVVADAVANAIHERTRMRLPLPARRITPDTPPGIEWAGGRSPHPDEV